MFEYSTTPSRFVALDIHKEYLVAVGVNARAETVLGLQRMSNSSAAPMKFPAQTVPI